MPDLVETQSYNQLIGDLKSLIVKGQQAALNAINEIKVSTYWEMGKRMLELKELSDPDQASGLVPRLAEDLGLDPTLIYRIMQFYRLWPNEVPKPKIEEAPQLSWTHYVELLSIKDDKEREFYFQQAAMEEWSRDTLRKAIQKDFFTMQKSPKKLKAGEPVLERGGDPLHIYKAVVERAVDGDTLLVRIDLGFEVWINQRIRFRGINTAELIHNGVKAGKVPDRADQAKAFVEERLKGIEFVVIKTYKTDMYGRYVADVFYHPTIKKKEDVYEKGFFLNAELLAEGLADVMM